MRAANRVGRGKALPGKHAIMNHKRVSLWQVEMHRFKTLLKKWARRYPWKTVKEAISVLLSLAKMSVELFSAEVNMRDI